MAHVKIELKDVWYSYPLKRYGFSESEVFPPTLQGITLSIEEGKYVAIMGPTGAGKTTFCLTLNGIIPHHLGGKYSGKVTVDGDDVSEKSIEDMARKIGLIFQDPEIQLFCTTVGEEVSFGPSNFDFSPKEIKKRAKRALSIVGLSGFERREVANLSGGEKQRLAIASVFAVEPEIMVLDESTSELDPVGQQEVLSTARKLNQAENKTLIVVEQNSEHVAEYADEVIVINKGKIVLRGTPREVFSQVEKLGRIGIDPPAVCKLAEKMKRVGILPPTETFLTVREAKKKLGKILKRARRTKIEARIKNLKKENELDKEAVIQVRGLRHTYPGRIEALRGIDLDIFKGDYLAIVGQNGSGKTTLVKHFNNLLRPTGGHVWVKSGETEKKTVAQLSRIVGYVFQNPDHQIFTNSVREELAYGAKNIGFSEKKIRQKIREIVKFMGLEGKENIFPFNLSKGERQKLAIGSILAMEPEILIIDEPTTGQDARGSRYIMKLIDVLHKRGSTIVIITHDMDLVAKYAERIVVLHRGNILLQGTPRDVFSKPEILKKSYLMPPQMTRLSQELADEFDFPKDILNTDEIFDVIQQFVARD